MPNSSELNIKIQVSDEMSETLSELASLIPNIPESFHGIIEAFIEFPDRLFTTSYTYSLPASARESIILIEPSEGFLGLMAALRAFDGD